MSDVLISLDDEEEKMLRELSQKIYKGKKGGLSRVVAEALNLFYSTNIGHKATLDRLVKTMERGYNLGYKKYEKRGELYEHRFKGSD